MELALLKKHWRSQASASRIFFPTPIIISQVIIRAKTKLNGSRVVERGYNEAFGEGKANPHGIPYLQSSWPFYLSLADIVCYWTVPCAGTFNQIICSSPRWLQFYSHLLQLEQFLSAVKANRQHGKRVSFYQNRQNYSSC